MRRTDYLKIIYNLGYATLECLTVEKSSHTIKKHFWGMIKKGWIKEIYQYGGISNELDNINHKIFVVTDDGRKILGLPKRQQVKEKSFRNYWHQRELIRIISGMYWYYRKEWSLTVKHNHEFRLRDKSAYRCDALVTMEHIKSGETRHFIIELEKTKSISQILKVKIAQNEKMKRFDEYGLGRKTKILYIKSSPNDDNDEEDRLFRVLLKQVGHLKDHYLFARYQDWHEYDKANFYLANGERIKIIN
jgi:hypothetical protein